MARNEIATIAVEKRNEENATNSKRIKYKITEQNNNFQENIL